MTNPQILYVALSLGAGLILLGLAYLGWKQRSLPAAPAFMSMMLLVAIWSIFYALELLATDNHDLMLSAHKLKYIGIVFAPMSWLLFAAQYSGRFRRPKNWQAAALLAIPFLSLGLVWTSEGQGLFYETLLVTAEPTGFPVIQPVYGVGFYIFLVYSYALFGMGLNWIMLVALRSLALYQGQFRIIIIAALLPVLSMVLRLTPANPLPGIDLTPVLFTISGIIFLRMMQRWKGMASAPIAYDVLLENLPNAFLVVDRENRILSYNPQLRHLLHLDEDPIIGQTIEQVFPHGTLAVKTAFQNRTTREELAFAGRHLDVLASPLQGIDGAIAGCILILRDDTVRKLTEVALYAHERRYRALFENSNDAIFIIELDFTVIIANERAANLLGIDLAKLLMHNAKQYIKADEHAYIQSLHQKLIEGNKLPLHECTFLRVDGREVPTEVSLTLVRDSDGKPLNIQMIVRDISDRKRTEAFMAQRLSQLSALLAVDDEVRHTLDMNTIVKTALSTAVRLSEADAGFIAIVQQDSVMRVEHTFGGYPQSAVGTAIKNGVGLVKRAMASQQPQFVADVRDNASYHENIPETKALMVLPLTSQTQLVGLINLESYRTDCFNEQKFQFIMLLANRLAAAIENARLYEHVSQQLSELQKLYEELRQAENLKTDMIRLANHDIKNPLSIIDGYLSLLAFDHELFDESYNEFFKAMKKSVDRMFKILDDFLSVERINERATGAIMYFMDLKQPVVRAVEEALPQLDAKSLILQQEFVENGQATVMGDEAQLYEALSNLISNAIKYTPEGGQIRIELACDKEGVLFAVHDTGFGIPEDRQEDLFKPFYRPKTDETADIEGTGLGLHLVKNIVQRHNGTVLFHSVHGKGSTFGFKLPHVSIKE